MLYALTPPPPQQNPWVNTEKIDRRNVVHFHSSISTQDETPKTWQFADHSRDDDDGSSSSVSHVNTPKCTFSFIIISQILLWWQFRLCQKKAHLLITIIIIILLIIMIIIKIYICGCEYIQKWLKPQGIFNAAPIFCSFGTKECYRERERKKKN